MTTNQGYAADGRTPLHNVPGRELLVSAVAFNGAVAEIARLQAQVDALADALVSAVGAMDLVEDSILGARRNRKPDSDGWYSEQMHKDEMDRVTQTKKQCEKALNSAGR